MEYMGKKALDNCSFIQALCDSELKSIQKINSHGKPIKSQMELTYRLKKIYMKYKYLKDGIIKFQ